MTARANVRRRQSLQKSNHAIPKPVNSGPPTPRVINAAPLLEKAEMYGIDDDRPLYSRMMALAGRIFIETIPQWIAVGVMLSLIFGGCCSNVFALEAIIKVEPASGMEYELLPTCGLQSDGAQSQRFLFVAVTGYVSQFDRRRPPFFIKANKVPLKRWLFNIILFFGINVLNNHAFSYDISVPVHIILRSGGSITTMIAGFMYGKRYPRVQVFAVILLTIGVVLAAWSDAQTKDAGAGANEHDEGGTGSSTRSFTIGLSILFTAQVMSAIMGLYTEETYRKYGPQWQENLFYSHILSLPLFIPFMPSLYRQFMKLAASEPLTLTTPFGSFIGDAGLENPTLAQLQKSLEQIRVPSQIVYLVLNVLTQYACIRGVNLLAAASSALTVTIVLNIRKLVSLLLSIWLFGNRLAPGTLGGAVIVFASGALYSMGGSGGGGPKARKVQPAQRPRAGSQIKVG
ncbi:UDP-N-acetylglucosamine transporter YEA4 [Pyricularia oryzae Y34]|uniref:UDP-N-acetylglucosamine transporter YEA4 n=1 Tax=Pyricularia oryzae (strain Y34) TaxID=1143189 RepID=A0AA97NV86_PYRO3|nr:UDP-N-acetylglucosamine transporter YEA4 [Pyricularia oryzae Y34]